MLGATRWRRLLADVADSFFANAGSASQPILPIIGRTTAVDA